MYIHTIDHVGLIFTKNKSILHTRPKKTKEWILPGGKLQKDETYIQALTRIVNKQLGVNLVSKSIQFFKTYVGQSYGQSGGIKIKITCFKADLDGSIKSKTNQSKFLSFKDKDKSSMISQMVFDDLKQQGIIS